MTAQSNSSTTARGDRPTLSSIAERIFVGIPVSRHTIKGDEPSVSLPVLSVGHIDNDHILPLDQVPAIKLRADNFDRFRLRADDIVVSCRGTILKMALVPPEVTDLWASSNIITIRANRSRVLPEVIFALLATPTWREIIESRTRSSTGLMQLTIKDLGDIPVPVPPREIQTKVAALLEAESLAYRVALEAANGRRALVGALISRTLLGREKNRDDGS
jgi:restriction endonuclease S subunit